MKFIVIQLIRLYYKIIPEKERRICIHYESCSKFVYRTALEKGGFEALKAYYSRFKSCNSFYSFHKTPSGKINIKTRNGLILDEDEINPILLKSIQSIS